MHGPATCAVNRILTAKPPAVRERSRRAGTAAVGHDVSLARQLELPGIGLDVEAAPLARAKRKTGKIETVKSR